MRMKFPEYLFFAVCFTILMATPAYAYVDAGMVTAALSVVTGILVAVGAVAGVMWRRAKKKVQDKLGITEISRKELEDEVEFDDDDED